MIDWLTDCNRSRKRTLKYHLDENGHQHNQSHVEHFGAVGRAEGVTLEVGLQVVEDGHPARFLRLAPRAPGAPQVADGVGALSRNRRPATAAAAGEVGVGGSFGGVGVPAEDPAPAPQPFLHPTEKKKSSFFPLRLLPKQRTYFYVCLKDGTTRIFPTSYTSIENQTHISPAAPV